MLAKIKDIKAREVLDSRGFPTVEVDVLAGEYLGRAIVPSGASTGKHEAIELRDGDSERYLGKGVLKALGNIEKIADKLAGIDVSSQIEIDEAMIEFDGTENKEILGANAVLAVSMACARTGALVSQKPLYKYLASIYGKESENYIMPVPMMNVINGGKHADSGLDIQEFMIVPQKAKSFREALRMGSEVFQSLKKILSSRNLSTAVGDEGGFAPRLKNNKEALEVLMEAILGAGYKAGEEIFIALDPAASEFFDGESYSLDQRKLTAVELIDYYYSLIKDYPIISIEDGLAEDDWSGWNEMTKILGDKIQIVGDDLFVTNSKRIKEGIEHKSANAVLIKLNQIGTVTETVRAIDLATSVGWRSVVSHRSGETEDTFIADFVVGMGSGQIKTGSLCRSERIAKYNQLLRIEEELGGNASYKS